GERHYVGGRGATEVHDEVRVDFGDLRVARAKAFEPCRLDEAPRVVARGVFEEGAGRAELRLGPVPLLQQLLGHPVQLHDSIGSMMIALKKYIRQYDLVGKLTFPITESALVSGEGDRARWRRALYADHHVANLA